MANGEVGVEAPRVDRAEMLRYLGYAGQPLDDELSARIDEAAAACEREARPSSVWRAFPLTADAVDAAEGEPAGEGPASGIAVPGTALALAGGDIARHLEGAAECVLLACTLGVENERGLRRRSITDPLGALLYDAASSSLIESAADAATERIAAEAATRGLHANGRFSPGYGDLPLAAQRPLLAALDATRRIGLTSTQSNLLVPTKSITAVIGLFDEPHPAALAPCDRCALSSSCTFRSEGRTCHGT